MGAAKVRMEKRWADQGATWQDCGAFADRMDLTDRVKGRRQFWLRLHKGAKALETFSYRYAEQESPYERFQVHKTIFPADFLADFGFVPIRRSGRVELARLDFGGLQPVIEGKREKVLRVVKEAFAPAPVPQRP